MKKSLIIVILFSVLLLVFGFGIINLITALVFFGLFDLVGYLYLDIKNLALKKVFKKEKTYVQDREIS